MRSSGDKSAIAAGGPAGRAVCLADFEELAASVLSREIWDFAAGGSGRERALGDNREAFESVAILPRVLSAVDQVDTRVDLLGGTVGMPVGVAPMAYQRMYHEQGELAAASAAKHACVPFVASTLSSYSIEDIAAVGARTWFQLYWLRDRGLVDELVRRAEDSGCDALMVTVDVPVMGARFRDRRNGFALPSWVRAANLADASSLAHVAHNGVSALSEHTRSIFDAAIGWTDLEVLRERTRLPLIVKGILDPRDAVRAVHVGADAVVVSNHGGRQLDAAAASIRMLPQLVDAVSGRCTVLVDSGVRSGLDVLRAMALGADGVLLGRPILWALAVDGENGVAAALRLLHEEVTDALMLAGCRTPANARDLTTLVQPSEAGLTSRVTAEL